MKRREERESAVWKRVGIRRKEIREVGRGRKEKGKEERKREKSHRNSP